MNTLFRLLLLCALGLPIAFPAWAHSPSRPEACRIKGAVPVAIDTNHAFTPAELQAYENDHPVSGSATSRRDIRRMTLAQLIRLVQNARPPKAGTRDATVRDTAARDLHAQRSAAATDQPIAASVAPLDTCGVVDKWTYAAASADAYCNAPSRGNGNAYFVVTAPGSFNAIDHHAQYGDYSQGLTITCYVCELPASGNEVQRTMTLPKGDPPPTKPAREH